MGARLIGAAVVSLGVLMGTTAAMAHCRDGRKTCEFVSSCMYNSPAHAERIRNGVRTGGDAGGEQVWGELAGCANGGMKWTPRGPSGEHPRDFDDVANGCSKPDYVAVGAAGVQLFDGNQGACNQIPE